MKILSGQIISKGISQGIICLYSTKEEAKIPHYTIEEKNIIHEITRFTHALTKTQNIIEKNTQLAKKLIDKKAEDIFMVHLMILKDAALFEKIKEKITTFLVNAEHAVNDVFNELVEEYKQKEAHFAELSQDFLEIKERLLNSFKNSKGAFVCNIGETSRIIMASEYLSIDSLLETEDNRLLGILVNECGFTSHAAILARSMNIPALAGINVKEEFSCNDKVIIDAYKGIVYVSPDKETIKKYKNSLQALNIKELVSLKYRPVKTSNNRIVKLKLNINTLNILDSINIKETDGIGLFRTEFAFLNYEFMPDVEAQFAVYKKIAKAAYNKEAVIRLLDIDSDKIPRYLPVFENINIDFGLRGAKAVEVYSEFYEKQMEALFLTAKEFDNVKVLYPMVSEFSDLMIYKNLYKKFEKKFNLKNKLQEGVLIEVPSAAIISNIILEIVDFVNIGSNDLLQYTLASDRSHPLVEKRYHILHPSLIYLIDLILKNANKHGKEVCLCGEAGSILDFYPLLINLGLESFSISPNSYISIRSKIEGSSYIKADLEKIMNLKEYSDIEDFIQKNK